MIPKKLQKNLPYKLKPKMAADYVAFEKRTKRKEPEIVSRCTAVILEPEESRIHDMMQVLKTVKDDKRAKDEELLRLKQEKRKKVSIH